MAKAVRPAWAVAYVQLLPRTAGIDQDGATGELPQVAEMLHVS